ncbi:MAG: ABC transporter substrate-binding protein [Myxacorys californica WJT36-NPBG1]|jgi:NitT/TauT family transport system substrate-binding protein|nr:ABC transporter substrate-binding protein [Myxacorys californica WJT36-NPBG1]
MNKSFKRNQFTRRQALWFATSAIASVGLHACRSSTSSSTASSSNASTTALTLGLNTWIGFTPLYIALAKGFFKDSGLDLKLQVLESTFAGFPAFLSRKLDGLALVSSEAITLAAKGGEFKIVAVGDTSVGADVVLARNSVASIQDFKGKKIGAELGGIGHFFVLQVLAEAGLSENDVTIVNVLPDAAAAAFQKGDLDIAYSFSPFSDQALKAQKDGRVIYSSKQKPTAIADLYIFSNQVIQSNPNAVAAFTEGHFKGVEFLKANPQEGLAIMSKQLNVTPDELAQQLQGIQIPNLATNLTMLENSNSDASLLKPLTNLATFLKNQNKVPTVPDMSKFVDPQFVTALSAKAK